MTSQQDVVDALAAQDGHEAEAAQDGQEAQAPQKAQPRALPSGSSPREGSCLKDCMNRCLRFPNSVVPPV